MKKRDSGSMSSIQNKNFNVIYNFLLLQIKKQAKQRIPDRFISDFF